MFDINIKDAKSLASLKESGYLEIKEAHKSFPIDALETYSAFANTDGGVILLGLKESSPGKFDITGVINPEKVIKEMFDVLNNPNAVNINLLSDKSVNIEEIDGKHIIIIQIPRANYTKAPIYLKGNPMRSYKRNRSGDYKCSKQQVEAMIRDASPEPIDGTIIPYFSMEKDFDPQTILNYRNKFAVLKPDHPFNSYNDMEFLAKIGALLPIRGASESGYGITLAGLLVFGKSMSIKEYLPHFHLEYVNKIGIETGVDRWSDRVIYDGTWGEGNLYNYFNIVINKLYSTIKTHFEISDDKISRSETTSFHIAIREALVNSIIHADYKIEGGIKVIRYSNKICFENSGSLRISKEDFFKGHNSSPRNHYIQEIFRHINLCERAGSGIPKIMEAVEKYSLRYPELDLSDTMVIFSLWDSSVIENADDLDGLEKKVVEYIINNKIVSSPEIEKYIQKSRYETSKILNSLIQKEYIERTGQARATRYIFKGRDEHRIYDMFHIFSTFIEQLKSSGLVHKS